MTPDSFNYQMCAIRHFKQVVKYIDSFQNFVFACDVQGNVGVFLIDENDLENDDGSLQTITIQTEGVEYLRFISHLSTLLLVTTNGKIQLYRIDLTGQGSFSLEPQKELQLNMKCQNLYVCPLDELGHEFFISNYPLDGHDFMEDQTINIFNANTQSITLSQTLDLGIQAYNLNLQLATQQIQNQILN